MALSARGFLLGRSDAMTSNRITDSDAGPDETDTSLPRSGAEYDAGRQARQRGAAFDENPNRHGDNRTRWFTGWLDADASIRFGRLFRKYGITWP